MGLNKMVDTEGDNSQADDELFTPTALKRLQNTTFRGKEKGEVQIRLTTSTQSSK